MLVFGPKKNETFLIDRFFFEKVEKKIRTSKSKQNFTTDRMESLSASENHSKASQTWILVYVQEKYKEIKDFTTIKKKYCYVTKNIFIVRVWSSYSAVSKYSRALLIHKI